MQYIKDLIKNRKHLKISAVIWMVLTLFFLLSIWANSERFEIVILQMSLIRGFRYAFLYWLVVPAVIKFWESGKLSD